MKHANFFIEENGAAGAFNIATEKAIEVGEHALTIILTLKEAVALQSKLAVAIDVVDPPIHSRQSVADILASTEPIHIPSQPNYRSK